MAGHNKWSKIKHKKAATDAKKSQTFGKLSQLIAQESKKASGDRNAPGLRLALEKARKENMPKENIERAIVKGARGEGDTLVSVRYETYGPGGSAVIIEGKTDNNNRTSQEIKHLLKESGCSLAEQGATLWAFAEEDGQLTVSSPIELTGEEFDTLQNLLEKIKAHEDVEEVYTNAILKTGA